MGDIVFVKPCLFKGRIEAETWSGLKKYYEMMEREVQVEKQDTDHHRRQDQDDQQPGAGEDSVDKKPRRTRPDSSVTKQRFVASNSASLGSNEGSGLQVGHQTLTVALLVIITILLMTTMALFKLASAISALSDRLGAMEQLLDRCLDQSLSKPTL